MKKTVQDPKAKLVQEIKNCRVVDIGIKDFGECLKDGPSTCSYALPFGYCFLCSHPLVDEIIENTKKVESFAGAER
jgi:hypothetical protein